MKFKPQFRAALFDRAAINEEGRTVELAFSSEEPVERWFGLEILDHAPASVRLGRLASGGAVLVDHDARDHVGVVESVSIGPDRRGRAVVRFGRSARADEVFRDVIDGIRTAVSVGYRILKAVVTERSESPDEYRVTDWEPFEISIVSIPADATVGVGRADQETENDAEVIRPNATIIKSERGKAMSDENKVDVKVVAQEAERGAIARVNQMLEIGAKYDALDLARSMIAEGKAAGDLQSAILERMKTAPVKVAQSPEIGMTDKEVRSFSFMRAINALANPTDRRAQEAARFEFEASEAAAKRSGKTPEGILVPFDVLKRDLNVGTTTAGGHLVQTTVDAGSFIDMLRARSYMMQLATVLTGLTGNMAIPSKTAGATAYWVTEGNAPTESQPTLGQVSMTPKTVGAFTELTRKFLLQSSLDGEAFIRTELAALLGSELDRASLAGSGSGAEPTGIINAAGVGAVVGGTDGLAPTWAHMVDLESQVAIANADIGTMRYVTNAKVRGKLKTTEKASGTAQFVWGADNMVNGYESLVTNNVPSNLVKGSSGAVCSAIIFGNFADLLIGLWGGLDLKVNPYALDTSGGVRVTALQDVDIALRRAASFAVMKDAKTA